MTSSSGRENSTITALSELQALEADRLAQIEAARQAAAAAEHYAWVQAQQRERHAAELAQAEIAGRLAQQQAEYQQAIDAEHARVAFAAAEARQVQDLRLRAEQQRIDVQIRAAERRARRRWPLMVVPALVMTVAAVGYLGWHSQVRAQAQAETAEIARLEQETRAEARAATLAAITAKLARLEAQRGEMLADLSSLDAKLAAAHSDADRARLEKERDELEAKLAKQDAALAESDRGSSRPSKPRTPRAPKPPRANKSPKAEADPPPTGRRDPIVLSGDKPLDGLEK